MATSTHRWTRAVELLARLRNDRYSTDEGDPDIAQRRAWNAGADHVTEVVERWMCQNADAQPLVEIGLRELREFGERIERQGRAVAEQHERVDADRVALSRTRCFDFTDEGGQ